METHFHYKEQQVQQVRAGAVVVPLPHQGILLHMIPCSRSTFRVIQIQLPLFSTQWHSWMAGLRMQPLVSMFRRMRVSIASRSSRALFYHRRPQVSLHFNSMLMDRPLMMQLRHLVLAGVCHLLDLHWKLWRFFQQVPECRLRLSFPLRVDWDLKTSIFLSIVYPSSC